MHRISTTLYGEGMRLMAMRPLGHECTQALMAYYNKIDPMKSLAPPAPTLPA